MTPYIGTLKILIPQTPSSMFGSHLHDGIVPSLDNVIRSCRHLNEIRMTSFARYRQKYQICLVFSFVSWVLVSSKEHPSALAKFISP